MAVIIPGAIWRPDPISSTPVALRWVILHTIVGTVDSSIGLRNYHCYYRADGTRIQIQDLLLRSAASVEANPYSIALAAEDKGPAFPSWSGSDVPAYTSAQVAALIEDLIFICSRFGLPASAIMTSRPEEPHGQGWHRLGIPGNFPPTWPLWGQQPGGQLWSQSTGKACPGDRRIGQIVDVIVPAVAEELEPEEPVNPEDVVAVTFVPIVSAGSGGTARARMELLSTDTARAVATIDGGTPPTMVRKGPAWQLRRNGQVDARFGAPDLDPQDTTKQLTGGEAGQEARCLVPSATGNGYWVCTNFRGVFSIGDAEGVAPGAYSRDADLAGASLDQPGRRLILVDRNGGTTNCPFATEGL